MSATSFLGPVLARLSGRRPYPRIGPAEAEALVREGALLLDVREQHEWRAGRAPRARHIPLGQLPSRLREVPANRRVVTVCRTGGRSARAAALLAADGRDVADLAGGMTAWDRAGLPVKASGGRPGRIV